jgi:hypothetical protein
MTPARHQHDEIPGCQPDWFVNAVDFQPALAGCHHVKGRDTPTPNAEAPRGPQPGSAVDRAVNPQRAEHLRDVVVVYWLVEPAHRSSHGNIGPVGPRTTHAANHCRAGALKRVVVQGNRAGREGVQ